MLQRGILLGAAAGVLVAGLAAVLANAYRCIDTPTFYNPEILAWAAFGVGGAVTGAYLVGARSARFGVPLVLIGVAIAAYALIAPPYRNCAPFSFPL
jgi:hypothetical protein